MGEEWTNDEEVFVEDDIVEEDELYRPSLLTNLLIILLILAMLTTIAWPLFVYSMPSQPTPTHAPAFQKST